MIPDAMPKNLLVIGSGAIGIEFASFYNALGANVTVVEMLDRILPAEDEGSSKFAEKQFIKETGREKSSPARRSTSSTSPEPLQKRRSS
ncbi:MAG: NAD-binding protein [Parvularculaceae bacterium]